MIQLYFLEYKKLELVDNYQNTAFENKLRYNLYLFRNYSYYSSKFLCTVEKFICTLCENTVLTYNCSLNPISLDLIIMMIRYIET